MLPTQSVPVTPMIGEHSSQSQLSSSVCSVFNNISVLWNFNLFSRLDLLSGENKCLSTFSRLCRGDKNKFGFNRIFNSYLLTKYSLNYPSNSLAYQHHFIEHTVEVIREVSDKYESIGQCIGYCMSFGPLKYLTLYFGFLGTS